MYRQQQERYTTVEDAVPNILITMSNGDSSVFVFPVYNINEDGTESPVDLSGYTFRVFSQSAKTPDVGYHIEAGLDSGDDNGVQNGIRLSIRSFIDTDEYNGEWPIEYPFNIVQIREGGDNESIVHGKVVIQFSPWYV